MKTYMLIGAIVLPLLTAEVAAQPQAYINENLGFNVKGYNYNQAEFPCNIDKQLVSLMVEEASKSGLRMEATTTADKIHNGVIPVVAMDVEQLVLGSKEHSYGTTGDSNLPKVQVTAAVIKGKDMVTAKHTCAIATLNELTPSSNVLDLGAYRSVCSTTRRCLKDLSKDIVEWVAPQLD